MRDLSSRIVSAVVLTLVVLSLDSSVEAASDVRISYVKVLHWDFRYRPADPIRIQWVLRNDGDTASGLCKTSFYISEDAIITPDDHLLGSRETSTVPAGQGVGSVAEFRVTATLLDGRYSVGAIMSCESDPDPESETCVADESIEVYSSPPDLVAQSVETPPDSYRPGESIPVETGVKNLGRRVSGSYSVDYYAVREGGSAAETYRIGGASESGVAPLQLQIFTATCEFPSNLPQGYYRIKVVLTYADDLNPGNNEAVSKPIWVGSFADLAVESVQMPAGTYGPGDPIVVTTVVQNVGDRDSKGYSLQYYLSTDATITTKDYRIGRVDCAALAAGVKHEYATPCSLPAYVPPMHCYVGVVLVCSSDGKTWNNEMRSSTTIALVHPAGYLCGRATYDDPSNWNHPIRYALVKIYGVDGNADPADDPLIAQTCTDGDGNYGAKLPSGAAGGPEVYVKVFTQGVSGACPGTTSRICTVKDHVLKQLYSLRSANYPYPLAGSVTIPMLSLCAAGEFMVYDSVVEGFEKARQFFGVELEEIPTYWPTSDGQTYYVPEEGIFVSKDDRGDRDVIMHEYGHFLADSRGFGLGSVGQDPIHYWNLDLRIRPTNRTEKEARNLAFREAWAMLFSIATLFGDSGYPYVGDSKYQDVDEITRKAIVVDLEGDTSAHKAPGEYYEHMNCCALWDIFDDNCDASDNEDTLSDPKLARIWAIADDSSPSDIRDFWNAWFARFGDLKQFNRIIWDHGMTFKAPVPTPTMEDFETGDFRAFAWIPGNPSWVVVPGAGRQQSHAARAPNLGNNQGSTLEVTMETDGGWIYFWVKTSCEQPWDPLRFSIDGAKTGEWSGETDWKQAAFPVAGGKHTFAWTFVRDTGGSGGANTVWVDDIEFPVW